MKLFALVFSLLVCVGAKGDLPLLGHNLTSTSYTLKKKQWNVGYYAVAYGIDDNWTIGTSPWLDVFYNMPCINLKHSWLGNDLFQQLSVELMYFHTYRFAWDYYDQESIFLRTTLTHRFSDRYALHTSIGYQSFFIDAVPYSLRLPYGKSPRQNLSISTLHEIKWNTNWGNFLELGVLGANYEVPFLHLGASIFYQWSSSYLQVGMSVSGSTRPVQYIETNERRVYVLVFHPEIQYQYFF